MKARTGMHILTAMKKAVVRLTKAVMKTKVKIAMTKARKSMKTKSKEIILVLVAKRAIKTNRLLKRNLSQTLD